MNTRPAAAALFVVFCLLLCGLILRRQIAAHPLPPSAAPQESREQQGGLGPQETGRRGFGLDFQDFEPAPAAIAEQVQATIQGQIRAMSAGDGPKALSYQSLRQLHNLPDPALFLQIMQRQWPEFGQNKTVQFGQVWVDRDKNYARVRVTAEAQGGQRIRGVMLLVREGTQFKIDGFSPFLR